MRKRELNRMICKIAAFLQTPEGRASLKKAADDAKAFCAEMRRKREVDPLSLFDRITI